MFRKIKLWLMNKKIDRLIERQAGLMMATMHNDVYIDIAIDERTDYTLKHGFRPHPRTLDKDWERLKRKYKCSN